MKKVIRLNENDIEKLVKKIIRESYTGSIIDFEGVTDSLVNKLVSNEFSEKSRDDVYSLAKKTLEGRTAGEKIKLYKLLAIKIGNYTRAFRDASSEQSSYYSIASRLEGFGFGY